MVREYAEQGRSRTHLARDFGCSHSSVCKVLARRGLDRLFQSRNEALRQVQRDRKTRYWVHCEIGGELGWYSLKQLARHHGLNPQTVYVRWRKGVRDPKELAAPARAWTSGASSRSQNGWELGLSMREWEAVLEYTRERGQAAAALKFDIPYAAITAARRGQWHRID